MVTPRFDELIHARTRLSIVALLGAADWAEFRFIRESLGISDSVLSKQLTLLENAGYVKIRKAFVGKRPRTWVKLSPTGRVAFEGHVRKLQEIALQGGTSLARDDGTTITADPPGPPERSTASSPGGDARA
ncbi:MAG: transcriptional regulator [Chloroflexota bacterium]|jgi:DNA-binding transcriptional ArsR family regulator|nr:transcriptional regulator [Chloroflexota bacterium]MDH5244372.1 transcriptional regulator [Chloroflexota bacterium]